MFFEYFLILIFQKYKRKITCIGVLQLIQHRVVVLQGLIGVYRVNIESASCEYIFCCFGGICERDSNFEIALLQCA